MGSSADLLVLGGIGLAAYLLFIKPQKAVTATGTNATTKTVVASKQQTAAVVAKATGVRNQGTVRLDPNVVYDAPDYASQKVIAAAQLRTLADQSNSSAQAEYLNTLAVYI
jgi:hypothetical protein